MIMAHPGCSRLENGQPSPATRLRVEVRRRPHLQAREGVGRVPRFWSSEFHLQNVAARRYPVIDTEAQIVLAYAVFIRRPGSPSRRNAFGEWFVIDTNKIGTYIPRCSIRQTSFPVPNRQTYDGNFPLPAELAAPPAQGGAVRRSRKAEPIPPATISGMSKTHERISPDLAGWIARQHVFFVATAPLAREGHVNVSPKGGDTLRILGPLEAAYQDYTGSGAETAAHLRENGRIVVMFCAFEGAPKVVRLHGKGELVSPGHPRYDEFPRLFPSNPGTRAYVLIRIERVSDACGYSVPLYEFKAQRHDLCRWAEGKTPHQLEAYRSAKNRYSIDGLPALPAAN
jgi:hypothetical protein